MDSVWILFKNNIKVSIIKKPVSFLVSLFAPLGILFLMTKILNFSSGYINIGVIDYDNSTTSKALIEVINRTEGFNVINISKDEMGNNFAENIIYGSIEFPVGFEEGILSGERKNVIITSRENEDLGKALQGIMKSEIINIDNLAKFALGDKEKFYEIIGNYKNNSVINVEKQNLSDLRKDYQISQIFLGFLILFMLIRGSGGVHHYYDEKNENIFSRLFIAPIKTWQYYLADMLSNYMSVLIQGSIGVLWVKIVGINIGVSELELLIILSSIGLVSVTLAMCVRSLCNKSSEFGMAFNFITMILVMVGGCFVPIEMMPTVLNNISYFTPVRWAQESLIQFQQGVEIINVLPYILVILLFALAFFAIGIFKTSNGEKEFLV